MVQFISIADCELMDDSEPTARITEKVPRSKMITLFVTN